MLCFIGVLSYCMFKYFIFMSCVSFMIISYYMFGVLVVMFLSNLDYFCYLIVYVVFMNLVMFFSVFFVGKDLGLIDVINFKDYDKSIFMVIVELIGGGVDFVFECVGSLKFMSEVVVCIIVVSVFLFYFLF